MLQTHPTVKSGSPRSLNPKIQELCDQSQPALTDLGNAQRFAEVFADTVRYVPGHGWFLFVESHWEATNKQTMITLASQSLEVFLDRTRQLTDEDTALCERILAHIARSQSLSKLQTMLRLASALSDLQLSYSELDADPYLITLHNGTLDLRSGELLHHNFKHYITHMLPYNYTPEATAPIWEEFLDRLTGSDQDLKRYLQQAIGATLFGASNESTCFVLTGSGQRAHQLFLSILHHLLGSYAVHTLSLKERSLTPTLLTSKLLTSASSALLRTSDPAILSALLNHEPLTITRASIEMVYQPRPTLWISAPELPQLCDDLAFLREYLQPIPLSLSLSSHEAAQLMTQLQAVLPAILNWAIEGFQLWYTEAPTEPVCVQKALATFQEVQEPLLRFFAQACITEPDQVVPTNDLYQAYRIWARSSGERQLSATRFVVRAQTTGRQQTHLDNGYCYQGLKLILPLATSSQTRKDEHTIAA